MSIRHHSVLAWEKKLRAVFDRIDDQLEERYGSRYPLHPARAPRGTTANKSHDGLFNIGAAFSPGFGSETGPGYVIEVRIATLQEVPEEVRTKIVGEVAVLLRQALPEAFPGQSLSVEQDGELYKISGDFQLGTI